MTDRSNQSSRDFAPSNCRPRIRSMDLDEGEMDPHRADSTLSGASSSLTQSKFRPGDVLGGEHPVSYSQMQDPQIHGPRSTLPPRLEQSGHWDDHEEKPQQPRDAVQEQEEIIHDQLVEGIVYQEVQIQDTSSLGVDQVLEQPQQVHPMQPKEEQESQHGDTFFKAGKASRGKEKLLEEDDFPPLERSETRSQKGSLSNEEQYAFPCDMQIPTLVDMSLPPANEFDYSPTLRGLRNACAFRQIQQQGIDQIVSFSDLIPTADGVSAEETPVPVASMCEAVHTDCHNLRTERRSVKTEDRRVTLVESGNGTWRTDGFIDQQLGVPVRSLGAHYITPAPIVTVPKSLEDLRSFENVVTTFRGYNNSLPLEQPANPFKLLSHSPDSGHAATAFETFDDQQSANEAASRAGLRDPNELQISEGASVALSADRRFVDKVETCISPGDSREFPRKSGNGSPLGVCYDSDATASPHRAPARPHGFSSSFADHRYSFKSEQPEERMTGLQYEEPNGPKFFSSGMPTIPESKMRTEILGHPVFPEMLAAHVACLRVTIPESYMLSLPEQLTRSQELLQAYSSIEPPHEEEIDAQQSEQLDTFMKSHTDALWNLQARLEHYVPQIVREAMLFISNVENETKALFCIPRRKHSRYWKDGFVNAFLLFCYILKQLFDAGLKLEKLYSYAKTAGVSKRKKAVATQDIDSGDPFESNMNEAVDDESVLRDFSRNDEFGPLVPTASERSIMERIREQLKQELTEEGYRKKIMEVRDEILRKRRAGKLPTGTTTILKEWWNAHVSWPYPTEDDKERLMEETGLELKQINNWFINQRKRNWNNGASSSKSNDRKNKHRV